MAAAAGYTGETLLDARLYHASVGEILSVLRSVPRAAANRVMIVGHNPGLEELVAQLTGQREAFPTAALAQITLPIDGWSELDSSTRGTLVGLWRPRDQS
jgi:phosphohistidine phosphatase